MAATDPPRLVPAELKFLLAAVLVPAIADALLGYSTPQLVIARVALAAGLLRGLEVFRQLLRVATIFALIGSPFIVTARGSWIGALLEFAAALAAFFLLGSTAVRGWCSPTNPKRDEGDRPTGHCS